jgi:glycosyltransferase involved in cell wall biosynthesis
MTGPRELICFGEDWGRHPSTAQFLVRQLLGPFRVIWINSLGWRPPRLSRQDLARAFSKMRSAAKNVEWPDPNLIVYTPLVMPWYRSAIIRQVNARLLCRAIRGLARRYGFSRYSLMTTYPAAAEVFQRIGGRRRVYYCADEYTTFPELESLPVRAMESRLLAAVDTVVTTSRALFETKSSMHPRVLYLPHAADVEHFAKAADPSTSIPDDVKRLPRPVIGFHGLIRNLIDLDIIDTIARSRPAWSVVMVGPTSADVPFLPRRHNIHYLGERPYDQIPAYLRSFDACLMPYRLVTASFYTNPVKLREYLAAGKPVVSTRIPEALHFGELLYVADSADEFIPQLERCLSEDPSLPARRIASMRNQTWAARAAELAAVL